MHNPTLDSAINTGGGRDADTLGLALGRWISSRWPGATLLSIADKAGSGASSELFFLRIRGRPGAGDGEETVALRLASRWPVYPVEDLRQQAACMAAIADRLPQQYTVPAVYASESHSLPGIEAPFLLMACVQGRAAPDQPSYVTEGWLYDLSDRERESLWCEGLRAIAAVHATPMNAQQRNDFALPCAGTSPIDRLLSYWDLFLDHVEMNGRYPCLRASVDWLHAHKPVDCGPEGFVWGDASLRNMLFHGSHPAVLLDFEFAHWGLRAFDVAFYPLMDYVMAQGFANGAPRLGGFGGMADSFDYYQEVSACPVAEREYFARTALTYMALSTTRVYQRLAVQGVIARADVARNPPLALLDDLMTGRWSLPV